MTKSITVEFYEIVLKTRNKRQVEGMLPPPIDHVNVFSAFSLLAAHPNLIGSYFDYSNSDFRTTLEHIAAGPDKINLVIGFYDKTAINRTMRNTQDGSENVQKRADYEAVKHFCHCVIKRTDDPLVAHIGIEKLTGCPASRINKTLKGLFKLLQEIAPNSEGVFQISNPDGATNQDGTDDISTFVLAPSIYPMCSEYLQEAILNGRFNKLRLKGRKHTLDDPTNKLEYLQAELDFKVTPLGVDETPMNYLQTALAAIHRNNLQLSNIKTFALIENEDTGQEQSVELATGNELNSAFVLRKRFDPTAGRKAYPDNTQINQVFLSEIWRLFI